MNARKKTTQVGQNKKSINALVRVTAVVVAVLLVFYFVIMLNNMTNIAQRVEERKDGAYPTSIAAGHIETMLTGTHSMMQMILALEGGMEPEGGAESEDSSEAPEVAADQSGAAAGTGFASGPSSANTQGNVFNLEEVERISEQTNRGIKNQMAILTSDRFYDEDNIHELVITYDEIVKDMNYVFSVWKNDPNDLSFVKDHIANNIIPLIEHAIEVDNAIIDSTTKDIDELYSTVLEAIQQTILFSFVLIMGIFVAIFIYISLLSRKEEHEQELSNHLKDALSVAQNANAAKSDFLSNMSHDIRTPLNAIIGLSAIAEDNINDLAKMRQCLAQINTSSHHLLQLINDVLDVNRIESGKTTLSEDTFSLPDLVEELSAINEPQINEKKLDAEFVLKNIQNEYMIGDPIRIRQIVLNLTSNAIKYTNPGDKMVVAFEEYRSTRKEFANIRITVSDTGVGMSDEFLEHIFEPFERERNERTNFIEGTGLGMSITKNLVTMMGGTIKVESELGKGSTFTVEMTLRVADKFPKLDTDRFKGVKVLVVNDDITSIDGTVRMLGEFEMDVRKVAIVPAEIEMVAERMSQEAQGVDILFVESSTLDEDSAAKFESILDEVVSASGAALIRVSDEWRPAERNDLGAGVTAYIKQPIFRSRLYETLRETLELMGDASRSDGEVKVEVNSEKTADSGSAQSKPTRVLIVEDNELNMEIATELIMKYGVQVDQAFNGVEALDLVKEKPEGYYGLIFMDWQMPVMDGIEATKAIIRHFDNHGFARTPIVAMTANAFNDNRREAMAAGMDGFMAKPINVKELKANLAKYCGIS